MQRKVERCLKDLIHGKQLSSFVCLAMVQNILSCIIKLASAVKSFSFSVIPLERENEVIHRI